MLEERHQLNSLYQVALLLTDSVELSIGAVADAIYSQQPEQASGSASNKELRMHVIMNSLAAVRTDLPPSLERCSEAAIGPLNVPAGWILSPNTTGEQVEHALLHIDILPRCALILTTFERLALADAAELLGMAEDQVVTASMAGLYELTHNLHLGQDLVARHTATTKSIAVGAAADPL